MTGFMIRLLLIIALLWVIRYVLGRLLGAGQRSGSTAARPQVAGNMVKDPVCGMYMDPRLALRSENGSGTDYYFCSDDCRKKFLASRTR